MHRGDIPYWALSARSPTLIAGISLVLVVESVALHALVLKRWPWVSVVLAVLNLWTIWWLVQDYRATAREPTLVRESDLLLRLGRRISGVVPLADVDSVVRPTWQQIPAAGSAGYVRLSGTDDPNVVIHLSHPATFRGPFGIRMKRSIVGLRLDDPDAFTTSVNERLSTRRM